MSFDRSDVVIEVPCPKPGCHRRVRVPAGKAGDAICMCPERHQFAVDTRGIKAALRIFGVGLLRRLRGLLRPPVPRCVALLTVLWLPILLLYRGYPSATPLWFAGAAALSGLGSAWLLRRADGDERAVMLPPLIMTFTVWAIAGALAAAATGVLIYNVGSPDEGLTLEAARQMLHTLRGVASVAGAAAHLSEPKYVLLGAAIVIPLIVIFVPVLGPRTRVLLTHHVRWHTAIVLAAAGVFAFGFVSINVSALSGDLGAKLTEHVGKIESQFRGLLQETERKLRYAAADQLRKAALPASPPPPSDATRPNAPAAPGGVMPPRDAGPCNQDRGDRSAREPDCPQVIAPTAQVPEPPTAAGSGDARNWPYRGPGGDNPRPIAPTGPEISQERGAARANQALWQSLRASASEFATRTDTQARGASSRMEAPAAASRARLTKAEQGVRAADSTASTDRVTNAISSSLWYAGEATGQAAEDAIREQLVGLFGSESKSAAREFLGGLLLPAATSPVVDAIKEEVRNILPVLMNGESVDRISEAMRSAAARVRAVAATAGGKVALATASLRRVLNREAALSVQDVEIPRAMLHAELEAALQRATELGRLSSPEGRRNLLTQALKRHVALPTPAARIAADGALLQWLDDVAQKSPQQRFDALSSFERSLGLPSALEAQLREEVRAARDAAYQDKWIATARTHRPASPALRDMLVKLDRDIEAMAFERSLFGQQQTGNWDSLFINVVFEGEQRFKEAWSKISDFPTTGRCVRDGSPGPWQTLRDEAELWRAKAECEGRGYGFGR